MSHSFTRNLCAIVAIVLFWCPVPSAAGGGKEVIRQESAWVDPGSVEKLAEDSTGIVRVRVVESKVFPLESEGIYPTVFTEHRVEILDVLKGRSFQSGKVISVLQMAGTLELPDVIIRANGGSSFVRGDEMILFISLHRSTGKWITRGPSGEIHVRKGVLRVSEEAAASVSRLDGLETKRATRMLREAAGSAVRGEQ